MVLLLTEELMMSVNATHNKIHVCCVKELLRFLKAMEWRPAPAEAGKLACLMSYDNQVAAFCSISVHVCIVA